jgi:hypothetical protein
MPSARLDKFMAWTGRLRRSLAPQNGGEELTSPTPFELSRDGVQQAGQ